MKRKINKFRLAMRITVFVAFVMMTLEVIFLIDVRLTNYRMLSEIEDANPGSYKVFRKFINDIEDETSWDVLIISGLRSKEKQMELIRENPKNAGVGKSRHVLGRAIDINLYKRKGFKRIWLKKFNSKRDWRNTGAVKIAARYNLLWGGTYRSYHDPVHFETR